MTTKSERRLGGCERRRNDRSERRRNDRSQEEGKPVVGRSSDDRREKREPAASSSKERSSASKASSSSSKERSSATEGKFRGEMKWSKREIGREALNSGLTTISALGGSPIAQQQCPLAVTGQWRC
eukprot:jgi/Psemu1/61106/gm1.61106_g